MPGLVNKPIGSGSFRWMLNTHGMRDSVTATIDISAFTKATHYPDMYLPSGLIVNVANPKLVLPFTGAAGEKLGFIVGDHETDGVEDRSIAVLTHGMIKTSLLPVTANLPATAPAGFYFTSGV